MRNLQEPPPQTAGEPRSLVRAWMSRPPVRVSPNTSLAEAFMLMRRNDVRHLLVMEGGDVGARLVGVVTDRDLRRPETGGKTWSAQDMYLLGDDLRVLDVMTRQIVSVRPGASTAHAAQLMLRHKVGCLPVIDDDGIVLGVLTRSDLLAALVDATSGHA